MHLPAQIDIGRPRLVHCVIGRLSEAGARIVLTIDARLPREFFLLMTADGKLRRRCRVLWRDELELSVEFLPDPAEGAAAVVEADM